MRALLAVAVLGASAGAMAQTFDVASIKRNTTAEQGMSAGLQPGGRWVMRNGPIRTLITAAYPADVPELVIDHIERPSED